MYYFRIFALCFSLLILFDCHAQEVPKNELDKTVSNAAKGDNDTAVGEDKKGEDEEKKKMDLYRKSLLEELSKDFQVKRPTRAIKDNYNFFIESIRGKKGRGFGISIIARILSIFFPGLYSYFLNSKVAEIFNKISPYREDDTYKANQKKIDDYDRRVTVKDLLCCFLDLYGSGIPAKDFSKNFKKIDKKLLHNAGQRNGSILSDIGFRLYLYECMSKLRMSPKEAYAKMADVSEDLIESIMQLLDEIGAAEEDFLRVFYENTSILQQYGIEDCATCDEDGMWRTENMFFTSQGNAAGKSAENFSCTTRFSFTTLMKNLFCIIVPIALMISAFVVRSKSLPNKITILANLLFAVQLLVFAFVIFACSKNYLYKSFLPLAVILVFLYVFLAKFFEGNEKLNKNFCWGFLAAVALLLSILQLKGLSLFQYCFNLIFYDEDTIITENLIAKKNASIARYIGALLDLHYIISQNDILREVFSCEVSIFEYICGDNTENSGEEAAHRNFVVSCINHLIGQGRDRSLVDVLSADFLFALPNIIFMRLIYYLKDRLAIFAFNAEKIRAHMNMFKNKDLRMAVISHLK